jgi:hypothetical protein
MNQNKDHHKKCPICGTINKIEKQYDDRISIIYNMCMVLPIENN